MNETTPKKSVLRLSIENAALRTAWRSKCCFTVRSFCDKHGFQDTRYLRAILKAMVVAGDLYEFSGEGVERGHAKLHYCAQQTDMMSIFEDALK